MYQVSRIKGGCTRGKVHNVLRHTHRETGGQDKARRGKTRQDQSKQGETQSQKESEGKKPSQGDPQTQEESKAQKYF